MSQVSVRIDRPAPAPDGPVACTLHPDQLAGRLDELGRRLLGHVVAVERPEPTRLRLVLGGDADPGAVEELLVREQGCCAFLGFTLAGAGGGRLLAELRVPAQAAPVLDAIALIPPAR